MVSESVSHPSPDETVKNQDRFNHIPDDSREHAGAEPRERKTGITAELIESIVSKPVAHEVITNVLRVEADQFYGMQNSDAFTGVLSSKEHSAPSFRIFANVMEVTVKDATVVGANGGDIGAKGSFGRERCANRASGCDRVLGSVGGVEGSSRGGFRVGDVEQGREVSETSWTLLSGSVSTGENNNRDGVGARETVALEGMGKRPEDVVVERLPAADDGQHGSFKGMVGNGASLTRTVSLPILSPLSSDRQLEEVRKGVQGATVKSQEECFREEMGFPVETTVATRRACTGMQNFETFL